VLHTVSRFFSVEDMCNLAKIKPEALRRWERTKVFEPEYPIEENGDLPLYSFRDIVSARVLAVARQKGVSLQRLRQIGQWLRETHAAPWASLRFYVANKRIYFEQADGIFTYVGRRKVAAAKPTLQAAMQVALEPIAHRVQKDANKLWKRPATKVGRITRSRGVMGGREVIAGTRIEPGVIRRFRDAGYTEDQILREYPTLKQADVRAALEHDVRAKKKRAG
jgi:uncharacterized protein (DUF433 family)